MRFEAWLTSPQYCTYGTCEAQGITDLCKPNRLARARRRWNSAEVGMIFSAAPVEGVGSGDFGSLVFVYQAPITHV